MDDFLQPLFDLVMNNPPLEIITTEPQNGRYPGVKQPIAGLEHVADPIKALQSFSEEVDLILVIGSLYLCGNILEYLGENADIL